MWNATTDFIQARCVLDSFFDGKHSGNDAIIQVVTNSVMRRIARRFANSNRTTDVLSFRLADKTHASRLARRNALQTPWDTVLTSFPPSKYIDIETLSSMSPEQFEKRLEEGNLNPSADDSTSTLPEQPQEVGTIMLAIDYCERMARKRNIPLEYYLMLATTHGLAHLVGHVHYVEKDYVAMKQAEHIAIRDVSQQIGFGDAVEADSLPSARSNLPKSYLP